MAITTTKALQAVPSAAAGVTLTPTGTAWNNTSWVQIIASTASAIQISAVSLLAATTATTGREFEVDIGTGTAGNEVVVSTIRAVYEADTGTLWTILLGIVVDKIPISTRVALRFRNNDTDTGNWLGSLNYFSADDSTDIIAQAQLTAPAGATGIQVAGSGVAWTNSAYGQLTAGFNGATYVVGLSINPNTFVTDWYEIDIATGGAGSETVVTTMKGRSSNNNGNSYMLLAHPLQVATTTRIAVRVRDEAGVAGNWTFGLLFYAQSGTFAPDVITNAVTSITQTTATGNGQVNTDGGAVITERGVCWNTSANPTTANSKATAAGTVGVYTASITGLSAGTLYHVRAYAINASGTSYGADVTFTTSAATVSGGTLALLGVG